MTRQELTELNTQLIEMLTLMREQIDDKLSELALLPDEDEDDDDDEEDEEDDQEDDDPEETLEAE
jgi:hypothetical protein